MIKIDRPSADRLGIRRVLSIDHSPTCGAKRGADAIDIGNDHARHRHFHHLTGAHESVLQINDDMRCAVWVQPVKYGDATTAEDHALPDFVGDT